MADTSKLARVRALLDTAESYLAQGNDEAAGSYQAKAEELIAKYRIEEEELIARDQVALMPGRFDIHLARNGPYLNNYTHMFATIARHCGLRVHFEWTHNDGSPYAVARGAGYQTDVEYAEMLFTAARMVFQERLEPKIDPKLSDQENVYRLRASGMERVRIAAIMNLTPNQVGRMYKAECAARGEEPSLSGRGVTGAAYREEYANQFVYTLANRLHMAQDMAGKAGGGLVLHGRAERIEEAYFDYFPERKPKATLPSSSAVETQCPKCAKSARGQCREHYVPMGRVAKGRDYYSEAAQRGRAAGAAAARAVTLRDSGTDAIGGA